MRYSHAFRERALVSELLGFGRTRRHPRVDGDRARGVLTCIRAYFGDSSCFEMGSICISCGGPVSNPDDMFSRGGPHVSALAQRGKAIVSESLPWCKI